MKRDGPCRNGWMAAASTSTAFTTIGWKISLSTGSASTLDSPSTAPSSNCPTKTNPMENSQYRSTSGSILGAIKQQFGKRRRIGTLTEDERLDGKTVLITGASSGLGYATAVQLARRGAEVIMAARSGIPEKGNTAKQDSGSSALAMRRVDLSDLDSIRRLADGLRQDGIKLDRLVLNAACVPARSRQTKQGLEEMFVVNFLSSFYLTNLLLRYDVLRKNAGARIVFVG